MSLGCVSFPFLLGYVMKFVLCTMHTLFFFTDFFFFCIILPLSHVLYLYKYTHLFGCMFSCFASEYYPATLRMCMLLS